MALFSVLQIRRTQYWGLGPMNDSLDKQALEAQDLRLAPTNSKKSQAWEVEEVIFPMPTRHQ